MLTVLYKSQNTFLRQEIVVGIVALPKVEVQVYISFVGFFFAYIKCPHPFNGDGKRKLLLGFFIMV